MYVDVDVDVDGYDNVYVSVFSHVFVNVKKTISNSTSISPSLSIPLSRHVFASNYAAKFIPLYQFQQLSVYQKPNRNQNEKDSIGTQQEGLRIHPLDQAPWTARPTSEPF